jgi:formylglycine-generating enzyme
LIADDLVPELVSIPAGPFEMGSNAGEEHERPEHTVYVDTFQIGVQPVSHAQYARFVRETGHRPPIVDDLPLVVSAGGPEREREFRAASIPYVWTESQPPRDLLAHPVTLVRCDDAEAYCRWLSAVLGKAVRLPSEAEWEKAARGGHERQRYPWGDHLDAQHANYLEDPAQKATRGTQACRSYPANGFGLYEMSGNVWEWVNDWYDAGYYAASPPANPPGPVSGLFRMVRGGGWLASDPTMLTCSHRHQVPPDTYSYGIGFRVVVGDTQR